MKIGFSTVINTKEENWDRLLKFVNGGIKVIEFYNKATRIRLKDVEPLLKIKKELKLDYSFHSVTQDLFCGDKVISRGEYYFLMAEISLAAKMRCDNFIFHINKKDKLNNIEIRKLSLLANFAKRLGVRLCLENNSSSGVFSSDYVVEILSKIHNLFFCLDVGHYNISLQKHYVKDDELFLNSIKKKIIELHISFNNGNSDQHLGYRENKGFDNYIRNILDRVGRKKLIIETKNYQQAQATYIFLKNMI